MQQTIAESFPPLQNWILDPDNQTRHTETELFLQMWMEQCSVCCSFCDIYHAVVSEFGNIICEECLAERRPKLVWHGL